MTGQSRSNEVNSAPERVWLCLDVEPTFHSDKTSVEELCCGSTLEYLRADLANARIARLEQRNEALESLLACYRLGKRPTEALFQQLKATRAALNDGEK